jgi:hypothetical protein
MLADQCSGFSISAGIKETYGRVYLFDGADNHHWDDYEDVGRKNLVCATPSRDFRPVSGMSSSIPQQRVFKQRVAQQIEPLLHLAHKLELQPLINRLHTFISSSAMKDTCILWGVLEAVFTDRVLNVVVSEHASEVAKSAWIDSVLGTRCGCSADTGLGSLLEPVPSYREPERVRFEAQLCAPLLGSQAGGRVQVNLDLFGDSTIRVGALVVPVVLQIGPNLGDSRQHRGSMIMSYDMGQQPESPARRRSDSEVASD